MFSTRTRVSDALEAADDAFWSVIADHFPEIKTGDFDPGSARQRDINNELDVITWISANFERPPVGARVRFKRDVYREPFGGARVGDTGTIVEVEGTNFYPTVQVDRYLGPGFHEWENSIIWTDEEIIDLHDDIEVIPSARDRVIAWLENELVWRVEIEHPRGQTDRISYVEATTDHDALSFLLPEDRLISCRRATPADIEEVIELDPDWDEREEDQ